jgi:hypothetical protein
LLAEDWGRKIFGLGAYLGEVIRRTTGGTWVGDDDDPDAEISVALHLPDGTICWPTQRVMKRFRNGPDENVVFYAATLGVAIPPSPQRPRGLFRRGK